MNVVGEQKDDDIYEEYEEKEGEENQANEQGDGNDYEVDEEEHQANLSVVGELEDGDDDDEVDEGEEEETRSIKLKRREEELAKISTGIGKVPDYEKNRTVIAWHILKYHAWRYMISLHVMKKRERNLIHFFLIFFFN